MQIIQLLALASPVAAATNTVVTASLFPIQGASVANVTGFVSLSVTNGVVRGAGNAMNLERMIDSGKGDCVAENGCGAHIHSGNGCEDATAQGGHLFGPTADEEDPWISVSYPITDEQGRGYFELDVDIACDDVVGKAFVIHANDGSRIACGILSP